MHQDLQLIARNQMVFDANRKSVPIAYLLWFFLGVFGAHRFYLGRRLSGALQLVFSVLGALTAVIVIGFVPLAVVAAWWLVDAALVPSMVADHNRALIDALHERPATEARAA